MHMNDKKKQNKVLLIIAILMIGMGIVFLLYQYLKVEKAPVPPSAYHWEQISAGGGGAMFSPNINPWDTNHLVIHCDMGGNYISYDGGQSFAFCYLNSRIFSNHFADENTLYMGGNALYKSEDKGKTFEQIFPSPDKVMAKSYRGLGSDIYYENTDTYQTYHQIQEITTNPNQKDLLFLLSKSNYSNDAACYYSDNGGESFQILLAYHSDHVFKLYCCLLYTSRCV